MLLSSNRSWSPVSILVLRFHVRHHDWNWEGGGRERSSFHTRMLKFVSVSVEVAFAPRFPDRLVVARPDRPINSQNINHDFPSLTLTLLLSLSVSSLLWMACPGWPSAIVRKLFTTSWKKKKGEKERKQHRLEDFSSRPGATFCISHLCISPMDGIDLYPVPGREKVRENACIWTRYINGRRDALKRRGFLAAIRGVETRSFLHGDHVKRDKFPSLPPLRPGREFQKFPIQKTPRGEERRGGRRGHELCMKASIRGLSERNPWFQCLFFREPKT